MEFIPEDRVDVFTIWRIERMLGNKEKLTDAVRARIRSEYGLGYNHSNRRWSVPAEQAFSVLVAKFPAAADYKKMSGLLYAVEYGNVPVTITKEAKK